MKRISILSVCLMIAMCSWGFVSSVKAAQLSTGWCCADGKVYKTTEKNCKAKNGVFFNSEKKARAACEAQEKGWCCADGKVFQATKAECKEKKGSFYTDKKQANKDCEALKKGWCCANGKVFQATKAECKEKKGSFYDDKKQANKACEALKKGWCCVDGKVFQATKAECIKKKGGFYTDKKQAGKACEALKKGWCYAEDKIQQLTKEECEQKKGKYFSKKLDANRFFRSVGTKKKAHVKAKAKAEPLISIAKVYQKDGKIHIVVKNKGRGRLSARDYKQGEVVLSYGGSTRTWSLKKIDPKGLLGRYGEEVEFDTGISLKKKERIRVKVDNVKAEKFKPVNLAPEASIAARAALLKSKSLHGKGKRPKPVSQSIAKGPSKSLLATGHARTPVSSWASSLPIQIVSPNAGDLYISSSTLQVRYRIGMQPDAGPVTFSLKSRVHGIQATMTDQYNPPQPGFNLGDSQLDGQVGSGLIGSEASYDDDTSEAFYNSFEWPLPTGLPEAEDYFIEAQMERPIGHLTGRSATFTIEAIGEGGGFATGSPAVSLLSPRSGDHFPLDGFSVEWRYKGPMDTFPDRWLIEGINPVDDSVAFFSTISCNRPDDAPAEGMEVFPSRTCRHFYNMGTTSYGNYKLRITGGDLSDETSGTFHWGMNWDWPMIQLFNPTPDAGVGIILGEPIPVHWSVTPASADLVVKLMKGSESVYTQYIPRSSCGSVSEDGSTRSCTHDIPTGDHFIPGPDYRIVVSSMLHSEARAERGPFSLLEPPFTETDADAVDFSISGLHVTETGLLQVNIRVNHLPDGPAPPATYHLTFLVGNARYVSGGIVRERDVPNSGGWIDLGHIDTFVTEADRHDNSSMMFTITVNQPVEVVERNYDNNMFDRSVRIRAASAEVFLANRGYYEGSSNTLYYQPHGYLEMWLETQAELHLVNLGYGPLTGTVMVRQIAREAPGELWGDRPGERIHLGSKEIHLPAPDSSPGAVPEIIYRSLFGGGIANPQWRQGELEIFFGGDFINYSAPAPLMINFRYRDY